TDGQGGVLLGCDVQQSTDSLYARSLTQSDLLKALGAGKAAKTVLIVDACFSGRTEQGSLVPGAQPVVISKAPPVPSKLLLFSAGQSNEFAGALAGLKRPAFSYLMLGALRGWGDGDGDGKVTADEAVTYARDTLRAVVTNRNQTPDVQGNRKTILVASVSE